VLLLDFDEQPVMIVTAPAAAAAVKARRLMVGVGTGGGPLLPRVLRTLSCLGRGAVELFTVGVCEGGKQSGAARRTHLSGGPAQAAGGHLRTIGYRRGRPVCVARRPGRWCTGYETRLRPPRCVGETCGTVSLPTKGHTPHPG
jgi:hypothetical protein